MNGNPLNHTLSDGNEPNLINTSSIKFIPSYVINQSPLPQSATEIDDAIKEMDNIYGTTFYSWIKSESNIAYICTYKKSLFEQYFALDEVKGPEIVGRVLRWLTEEWSVPNKAALILKLFYHWNIESPRFAQIVAQLTAVESQNAAIEYDLDGNMDLIQVLLIGEPAQVSAMFLKQVFEACAWIPAKLKDSKTSESHLLQIENLVRFVNELARRLKWNERFFCEITYEFANIFIHDPVTRLELVSRLELFESRDDPFVSGDPNRLFLFDHAFQKRSHIGYADQENIFESNLVEEEQLEVMDDHEQYSLPRSTQNSIEIEKESELETEAPQLLFSTLTDEENEWMREGVFSYEDSADDAPSQLIKEVCKYSPIFERGSTKWEFALARFTHCISQIFAAAFE